ncbi:bcl2/adenovirus E1b 19-kda protein-interacting protein [Anopheles darlingi]|uniref:Bcl2/adenovirus E1b 19-kDa protein-interacting protein n=1 Tax=Anopheles darlingi TaxID=43151 RepID=W5JU90_ANODA|nr:bcl2/adenovirus E1b 19-kda protein-interacting protein [Anopheles darlingi]
MSQCLEDSPLSDNRMDISENTTSHESPPIGDDFSPDNDDDGADVSHREETANGKRMLFTDETTIPRRLGTSPPKPNDFNGIESHLVTTATTTATATTTSSTLESIDTRKPSSDSLATPTTTTTTMLTMDGGRSRGPSPSRIVTSSSSLTPVSNHPLMMSPTGSESDFSDVSVAAANRNYYHYPDVVPASEQPLRLASPYSSRKMVDKQELQSVIPAALKGSPGKSPAIRSINNYSSSSNTSSSKRNAGDGKSMVTTSTLDVINTAVHSATNGSSPTQRAGENRDTSPRPDEERIGSDFLSSDSEPEDDGSLFQAAVTPSFQSVALLPSPPGGQSHPPNSISPRLHQRRKVPLPGDLRMDDASSIEETLSNQSVDELQQNLVSLSPSSSILDDNGFNVDIDEDFLDLPGTPKAINRGGAAGGGECSGDGDLATGGAFSSTLPQYSARDEARDIRNWQKITLPDGKTREIDMKVIEPYKCVLSHGGYLQAGGHNAIVVFSACHLPDRSRADYHYVMNNLFLYVVKTLEQLVTEDYVLVYLHGGSSRSNVPPFPWLKKCYQLLDRRLRKSLRNLYMVHPTFWLKSVVWMARPFISSKFWRKLVYVTSLENLYRLVPVEKAAVPDKVKLYDSR